MYKYYLATDEWTDQPILIRVDRINRVFGLTDDGEWVSLPFAHTLTGLIKLYTDPDDPRVSLREITPNEAVNHGLTV